MALKINSKYQQVTDVFCDKISFITCIDNPNQYEFIINMLHGLTADNEYGYKKFIPGYSTSHFLYAGNDTNLPKTKRNTLLFQLATNSKKKLPIRCEFNPQKVDMAMVHEYINCLAKCSWDKFIKPARITRIDLAVDLPGMSLEQLAFNVKGVKLAQAYTGIQGTPAIQTLYFGSKESKQYFAIYDKGREESKKTGKVYIPKVRIEARLRNQKIPYNDLLSMKNPFESLDVFDLRFVQKNSDEYERCFWSLAQYQTVRGALKKSPKNKIKSLVSSVNRQECSWWEPKEIWNEMGHVFDQITNLPPATNLID